MEQMKEWVLIILSQDSKDQKSTSTRHQNIFSIRTKEKEKCIQKNQLRFQGQLRIWKKKLQGKKSWKEVGIIHPTLIKSLVLFWEKNLKNK